MNKIARKCTHPVLAFLIPPFSFLCHAGRSVSSQRNELFATGRLIGKVMGDLRQARMRQANETPILVHPSYRRVLAVPLIHHDRGDLAS